MRVDRVDTRPPLGDDFEARSAGLQDACGVLVIPAYRAVELTGVFEQLGFLESFTHLGHDQVNPVALEYWSEAVEAGQHVRGGEKDSRHVINHLSVINALLHEKAADGEIQFFIDIPRLGDEDLEHHWLLIKYRAERVTAGMNLWRGD